MTAQPSRGNPRREHLKGIGRAVRLFLYMALLSGLALGLARNVAANGTQAIGGHMGKTQEQAAAPSRPDTIAFAIRAQDVAEALIQFGEQADVSVMVHPDVTGIETQGVRGNFAVAEALRRLLAGTGLDYRMRGEAVIVSRAPAVAQTPQGATGRTGRSPVGRVFAAIAAALATVAAPAGAEEGAAVEEIEEIIVTALRRAENIQDVPVAITALTSEDITTFRFRDPGDLAAQVPNLQTSGVSGDGTPVFGLRGVSMHEYSFHQNSPIAPYVDEVYKSNPSLLAVPLFDIERVEVLRGPQGTLYGKNTTGGAINFISKKPAFERDGYFTLGTGNYNLREAEGAFNVALSDTLALRLAATWAEADGWLENVLPGVDDAYSIDEHGVRLSALWQPNDGFEVLLRASTAESSPVNWGIKHDNDAGPGSYFGVYGLYNAFGATTLTDPNQIGLGHFQINSDQDADRLLETDSVSLTLNWAVSDAYTLTSITSWDDGAALNPDESDGTPNRVFVVPVAVDANQITQDLRLTSNLAGPFNFVAGLYYAREQVDAANRLGLFVDLDLNIDGVVDAIDCLDPLSIAFGLPPSPAGAATDALFGSLGFSLGDFATFGCYSTNSFEQEKTSNAAYFDGNYALNDSLTLRFGLRYTNDEANLRDFNAHYAGNDFTPFIGTINGGATDPLATDGGLSQSNSDSKITGRLGIDYTFAGGNLLYASFSQGYRGGAYNGQAYNSPAEVNWVQPEYLDSLEIGFKSSWWDGRMRLNVAAFQYSYENQHILDVDPFTFIQTLTSIDESEITGAEIEVAAQLTPALRIQLGVGLLDAEVKSGAVSGEDLSGAALPNTSDINVNAAIDWDLRRFDAGVLTLHANGTYRSETPYVINLPGTADGYTLFNGRLTFVTDTWSVSLWGKNLAEKEYFMFYVNLLDTLGVLAGQPGPARTYGAEFTYRF